MYNVFKKTPFFIYSKNTSCLFHDKTPTKKEQNKSSVCQQQSTSRAGNTLKQPKQKMMLCDKIFEKFGKKAFDCKFHFWQNNSKMLRGGNELSH